MSTRHYTLPVEQTEWRVPGGAVETVFTWDYDDGRDKLLALYEKGKANTWNATDLDWSIDVDLEKTQRDHMGMGSQAVFNQMLNPPHHLDDDQAVALNLNINAWIVGEGLLSHNGLVYLALALVGGVWWLVYRTRFGLRLRAVGENPHMVDAAGVSVLKLRYAALTLNGMLCGLAGGYLVLAQSASFAPNMTAGRGYMALAALIFGHWKPLPALLACLLFGFLDAAAIRLQGVSLPGLGEVPVQAVQALPYLLTVVLLAGFIGRTIAPKALGLPYLKER